MDSRILLGLIHRYGEARADEDHYQAGRLYSEIVRAIQDDEKPPRPAEAERGGLTLLAS